MDVSKYAALFLAESQEHLRSCNRLLLEWERKPAAAEPVGGLFRAIHTIKGMAATMGYTNVADLAHRTENLLDELRAGRAAVTGDTFTVLFRAVDALTEGVEAAAAGQDAAHAHPELNAQLEAAATASHPEGAAAVPAAPTAAPAPKRRGKKTAPKSAGVVGMPAAGTAASAAVGVPAGGAPQGAAGAAPAAAEVRLVRVAIRSDAMLRGARAMLAVRKAEALGLVTGLQPPAGQVERDEFDGRFSFRLQSGVADAAVIDAIRAAGDVASVTVEADVAVAAGNGGAGTRQIRVDLVRLDTLMKQVGELVVARNRLTALAGGAGDPELVAVSERICRLVAAMQGEVLQARMTPVGEVFERFPRLVRDLAQGLGKEVRLALEGDEIELDRSVLDEIGDPLMHLLRNALDHGVESPATRVAAGKRREGRVTISAARERNSVAIRVSDDGRGIDRAKILAKAKREGMVDAAVEALSDDLLMRVLARPGFSTAEQVSGVSGRGVGVDVALSRIRSLGGTLELQSEEGRGTTWTLRVPLTLAIVRALLTRVGTERYAVPLAYVAETVEFLPQAVSAVRDREALVVRDRVMPTVHLRQLFAVDAGPLPARRSAIILEVGERRAALVVDVLLGQQDIVVEPFDAPAGTPPFFSGATILADGAPALILDAAALI